jgi:phosphoenolpyruvate synthase/pyruvate phosphate dikinase
MIKEELTKQEKAEEFENVSALLGEAVQPSFIGKYQLELLEIAAEIKKAGMYETYKSHSTKEKKNILQHKKIAEAIYNIQQRYFWMNNAYAGTKILPASHFVRDVQEICRKFEDPEQESKRIHEHFATLQKRKKQACEKYHLSDELQQLIVINDNIGIIHDYRKEVITYANYFIDEFIKRIASEKHISLELMRYVSELECTEELLATITPELLEERRKTMVHIVTSQQEEYIFSGKEAEEFIQEVSEQHQHQEEEILKGYCASQGHVQGKVKVCRGLAEIAKFEEGNVLVACMTQPEFVPAMKKAVAVVTDEGGLTCHAAIISRELGKPCVISTKKATKVLKDGMVVDVNATEGIVRIIKKP